MTNRLGLFFGVALVAASTVAVPRPAQANSTSAALIAAGAAAIIGALLTDSNNQPYYVNNNRRYYVTQGEARYYREHEHAVVRQVYVPQAWSSYPVARNAGYQYTAPQQAYGQYNRNGPMNGNPGRGHNNGNQQNGRGDQQHGNGNQQHGRGNQQNGNGH